MNNKLISVSIAPENAKYVLDNNQGWIALIDRMGEEIKIVNAARVSFGKMRNEFNDKDKALLKFLIDEEHFAPLEHITMTFLPIICKRPMDENKNIFL